MFTPRPQLLNRCELRNKNLCSDFGRLGPSCRSIPLHPGLALHQDDRPSSLSTRTRSHCETKPPLTRSRYVGWSALVGSALLLQAYMAVWSGEYKGWSKLIPIAGMISGAVPCYHLQKRWRKQRAALNNQL